VFCFSTFLLQPSVFFSVQLGKLILLFMTSIIVPSALNNNSLWRSTALNNKSVKLIQEKVHYQIGVHCCGYKKHMYLLHLSYSQLIPEYSLALLDFQYHHEKWTCFSLLAHILEHFYALLGNYLQRPGNITTLSLRNSQTSPLSTKSLISFDFEKSCFANMAKSPSPCAED